MISCLVVFIVVAVVVVVAIVGAPLLPAVTVSPFPQGRRQAQGLALESNRGNWCYLEVLFLLFRIGGRCCCCCGREDADDVVGSWASVSSKENERDRGSSYPASCPPRATKKTCDVWKGLLPLKVVSKFMPWPKGLLPILLRYIRGNREGMWSIHIYTYIGPGASSSVATVEQRSVPFFDRFR